MRTFLFKAIFLSVARDQHFQVQCNHDLIHLLQVPIFSLFAQTVHESARLKVKGLSFIPKALWDEPNQNNVVC